MIIAIIITIILAKIFRWNVTVNCARILFSGFRLWG